MSKRMGGGKEKKSFRIQKKIIDAIIIVNKFICTYVTTIKINESDQTTTNIVRTIVLLSISISLCLSQCLLVISII